MQDIHQMTAGMETELIAMRRDFHKYAESAWTEFRTASLVADRLTQLGYQVLLGDAVTNDAAMMGVPDREILQKHTERALSQGAVPKFVAAMAGGKTGVVGVLETGRPGPVAAFRFDMDANDVNEAMTEEHRPYREGFRSVNEGAAHCCGHDGHTTIGMGLAKILMQIQSRLCGTIKLIFQPAEEGVRGAKAMAAAGVVDDVQYVIGMHIGFLAKKTGRVICGGEGFLATTKFDAEFTGKPAHAGAAPEQGRNALLAAAAAAINLHAISRHSEGVSRINVGVLQAGSGRNVIPAEAVLKLETRGQTTAIDGYMKEQAERVIKGAAAMYDVAVKITEMGGAVGGKSDPELVRLVRKSAQASGLFEEIIDTGDLGGSEDFTYFMERVQAHGGQALYAMVGTDIAAGHHDGKFDFDESVLVKSVELLSLSLLELQEKE